MDPKQQAASPQDIEQQIIAKLKEANNVLVTVSRNPSVDQLAGAIGFALVLNKLKKHAAAVFSGQIPSVLEFLQPEQTLEKTPDSLRDFIIALDKAKADKLRYKVEDKFVKIFITPYHTSISDKDLEFSQGEFNIDAVVALGVKQRDELDEAIMAHGNILHDATVISVNNQPGSEIGSLNLVKPDSSSLCEMLVTLSLAVKGEGTSPLFDQQMATAFLTGVVAETDRFSNDKTTPQTMSTASALMKAGANQQLVASKLDQPEPEPEPEPEKPAETEPKEAHQEDQELPKVEEAPVQPADGSLTVLHGSDSSSEPAEQQENIEKDQIDIDDEGKLSKIEELKKLPERQGEPPEIESNGRVMLPPSHGGTLTASSLPEDQEDNDILNLPKVTEAAPPPLLSHEQHISPDTSAPEMEDDGGDKTLEQIEEKVNSPHLHPQDQNPDDAPASDGPAPPPPVPPPFPLPPQDTEL